MLPAVSPIVSYRIYLQVHLNSEKRDSVDYSDKFTLTTGPKIGRQFVLRGVVACVFVSTTSLAACLAITDDARSRLATRSLSGTRNRIKHAAIAFTNGVESIPLHVGLGSRGIFLFQMES